MPEHTPSSSPRRVLAVDTSSMVQSVAVVVDDRVMAERTCRNKRGHASALLGAIDGALTDAGLTLSEVDLLAVGAGPGSFTGLRIGLASLKAMAWVEGLPLMPVSSLEALARGAAGHGLIVPVFDARKGQVYAGLFRRRASSCSSLLERVAPDAAFDPEPDLVDAILAAREEDEHVILLGEGLRRWGQEICEPLADMYVDVTSLDAPWSIVRASHLAALAVKRAAPGEVPALGPLEPNYQRASEAEINWAARREG